MRSEEDDATEINKRTREKKKIIYSEITEDLLRTVLYRKSSFGLTSTLDSEELRKTFAIPEEVLLSMPKQVKLAQSSLPTEPLGVFSSAWIKEGTEMGPFVGRIRRPDEVDFRVDNKFMWEVFSKEGRIRHFVDASETPFRSTWIAYVQCARSDQEQNLEVVQIGDGDDLYYRAIKDIPPEQELLVWYSSSQPTYLGIPDIDSDSGEQSEIMKLIPSVSTMSPVLCPSGGRLKCVVCRRGFNSRSNLRSHMRIHTLEKPFSCKFCQRSFSQSSTLRNHVRLHTGEKPYKCLVCQSAYSQLAGLRAHQKSARHRPVQKQMTSHEIDLSTPQPTPPTSAPSPANSSTSSDPTRSLLREPEVVSARTPSCSKMTSLLNPLQQMLHLPLPLVGSKAGFVQREPLSLTTTTSAR